MISARPHKLVLGFAHWGKEKVSPIEMIQTVKLAVENGIDEIDCAPHYGNGAQEATLGTALRDLPEDQLSQLKISTKVGRIIDPNRQSENSNGFTNRSELAQSFDYSKKGIELSFYQSQLRMCLPRVHAIYLHDMDEVTHKLNFKTHYTNFITNGYTAFNELKNNNKIEITGIGSNDIAICVHLIKEEQFKIDRIMIAGCFNLLDHSALNELFPLCKKHHIQLYIAAPYAGGILSDPMNYFYKYEPASDEIKNRKQKLLTICENFGIPLAHAAMQFVHAHPQVERVVVGARTRKELESSLTYAKIPIKYEFWAALQAENLISQDCLVYLTAGANNNEFLLAKFSQFANSSEVMPNNISQANYKMRI